MRFRTVLLCAVLDCTVSCCATLCPAVLCCAVLCCAVLCCAAICCAVLCSLSGWTTRWTAKRPTDVYRLSQEQLPTASLIVTVTCWGVDTWYNVGNCGFAPEAPVKKWQEIGYHRQRLWACASNAMTILHVST